MLVGYGRRAPFSSRVNGWRVRMSVTTASTSGDESNTSALGGENPLTRTHAPLPRRNTYKSPLSSLLEQNEKRKHTPFTEVRDTYWGNGFLRCTASYPGGVCAAFPLPWPGWGSCSEPFPAGERKETGRRWRRAINEWRKWWGCDRCTVRAESRRAGAHGWNGGTLNYTACDGRHWFATVHWALVTSIVALCNQGNYPLLCLIQTITTPDELFAFQSMNTLCKLLDYASTLEQTANSSESSDVSLRDILAAIKMNSCTWVSEAFLH